MYISRKNHGTFPYVSVFFTFPIQNSGNMPEMPEFLGNFRFMSIRISQMKDHFISVDQYRYATSIVAKYLDTTTFKASITFYDTTLPSDMIFTKYYVSSSDEQVEKLTRESIFASEFVLYNCFICYIQEWI